MDDGYPKEIEKGFEGIPNNVDAAFVWTGNEKIYFFKVGQCLHVKSLSFKLECKQLLHNGFVHFIPF